MGAGLDHVALPHSIVLYFMPSIIALAPILNPDRLTGPARTVPGAADCHHPRHRQLRDGAGPVRPGARAEAGKDTRGGLRDWTVVSRV